MQVALQWNVLYVPPYQIDSKISVMNSLLSSSVSGLAALALAVRWSIAPCSSARPPLLRPDRVRLVLPMVSLIPPEIEAELSERFGERFARLDEVAVQAVMTARVGCAVTNGRLQEITGQHPKDITAVLQGLVRDGFLEQQNQRRWASYRLAGGSPRNAPQSANADSPQSTLDSPQSPLDSSQSPLDSPQSAAGAHRSDRESPSSTALVPDALQPLLELAKPARQRRKLPAAEMRRVIHALCRAHWLTASEVALLVDRDAENLQSRFLTAMVREGTLELRYPDVPNRPDQAYRTRGAT